MVRFDKKWFNPLFFILNDIIKDDTIRTVLIYGGKSSSKTYTTAQLLTKECYLKKSNVIAFRKEGTTIRTTLLKSFQSALKSLRLHPVFEELAFLYRSAKGSEIVFKGLDSEEKAKGIESYKYLYLDELNHFELEEYRQFNLSLRGMAGQKIFASWNPVDEKSWVKTDLVDSYEFVDTDWKLPCAESFVRRSTCGKVVLIKTSYEDNYWIAGSPCGTYGFRDNNLIAEYESLRTRNFNSYRVNVLGEWGKTDYGGEFLKSWRSETHTGIYNYDPECAIYLWFDENVNPYFPCAVFQVGRDQKSPRMIHHIAAKSPNNKVQWVCAELRRKLIEWGHKGRVYVGGDATSQKDDVKQEKGHDLFRLIMNELKDFNPERRIPDSNPSVIMSANFVNSILDGAVEGLSFGADKSCITAITDFENTKEDKNGKIDKKTVTNPITKVTYQPYGHFVDILRYFLTYVYSREYLNYQRGGVVSVPISGRNLSKNNY